MIVAVIGAGGFAGRALGAHFRDAGADVVPVGRATPPPGGRLDVVVDCNGDARRFWANENPEESYRVNVLSTTARLRTLDFGTYVYLSTVDVYGPARGTPDANTEASPIAVDKLDTYGHHKFLAEEQVRAQAPDHLILRAGTLLGPGLKKNPVFDALNRVPIRQTPDSTLTLITTEALAGALDRLLDAGARGTFNVTARASIGVSRMLELVSDAAGGDPGGHTFDDALMTTDYDINIDKVSRHVDLPDSEAMLATYLAGPR